MKISLEELKRSIQWVEANSGEVSVNITELDNCIQIETYDRGTQRALITLFSDGTSKAKIRREEIL